jgi:tripartite-type tricarboxylate transporter receptor subunit TctC
MRRQAFGPALAICVPSGLALTPRAHAQAPAEFYRGKTDDLYIGTSVGGGYDAYARMLARHMGKYMPGNPTIAPKNMEGGHIRGPCPRAAAL